MFLERLLCVILCSSLARQCSLLILYVGATMWVPQYSELKTTGTITLENGVMFE